ncbi:hypothetical protein [Gemelliphila palaticanis]|uniref:Uncharacterized protein n=1 Tax=Gemelliphila palaticanis TaxID=81950 RepID=A0ABX2T0T5_9BACL|nr:hypothetical protein [Gemella palaticanis]MBF0716077.1 hypothetical protein [Gemella palaticanis]NYS48007.1 hypothetical protein [Gemella palaticanis]
MRILVEEKYNIFEENKKKVLENNEVNVNDKHKVLNKLNIGNIGKGKKYKFKK